MTYFAGITNFAKGIVFWYEQLSTILVVDTSVVYKKKPGSFFAPTHNL